jgi:hypothetical protein
MYYLASPGATEAGLDSPLLSWRVHWCTWPRSHVHLRCNLPISPSSGSTDFVDANRGADGNAPFGWESFDPSVMPNIRRINADNMWLYEWTDGVVTPTPSSRTFINAAIGGWQYGDWQLSLNKEVHTQGFCGTRTLLSGLSLPLCPGRAVACLPWCRGLVLSADWCHGI